MDKTIDKTIHPLQAIGLRSDTAITGVEAALIKTDGIDIFEIGPSVSHPYSAELKREIQSVLGEKGQLDVQHLKEVDEHITQHHIEAVETLLRQADKNPMNIDVIGFPGHTVLHRPSQKLSRQIGNAETMLQHFEIPVVTRFAGGDLAAGGQGSPLFPSFYEAITHDMEKPLAVLTIGGLASLTAIGLNGELIAFDVGPGNILIDTWMQQRMGAEMDFDGLWAAKGTVDERLLKKLMAHPFLSKKPPKSMDRDEFNNLLEDVEGSTIADGAATLTAFTAEALHEAVSQLPFNPKHFIVTGGGAQNPSLIKNLKQRLNGNISTAQEIGWNAQALEAQGFAFLATRTYFDLPISFPSTTGVPEATPGGTLLLPATMNDER